MYLRKTTPNDLPRVMEIIDQAAAYLAEQRLPQWQGEQKPSEKQINKDIERQESYVLIDEGVIVGTASLVAGIDPVYTAIDGKWEGEGEYLSIHRVALDQKIRGKKIGKQLLEHLLTVAAYQRVTDVRIDTFPTNQPMERTIYSAGFSYCGMIEFPFTHGERKAYQKCL
ncbi:MULTISPECIES: GNAT family N-acetyltransferase [unclassified Enterococcus]|uniref:GNAT family N-acetyltransferase n=1 Tax=unclassified Enterococcus TaxID=2608891 RepID=UPI001A9B3073|nr:GNAT family N-acetyltransferase [Enterococcus sp. DIV1271a]MBO1299413.1 GNAT family N-acetyltransferase [Enterococcus sp. DIV1271a]